MLRYELEIEADEKAEDFKSMVFANDRKLYAELFAEPEEIDGVPVLGDEDLYYPETSQELEAMIGSMQRRGVLGAQDGDE